MDFIPRLLDEDGTPLPVVVPNLRTQIDQLFASLALQEANPVRIREIDDKQPEDEDYTACVQCSKEYAPVYVDEDGVCDDCHAHDLRHAESTAPFCRSKEQWNLLIREGYIDDVE